MTLSQDMGNCNCYPVSGKLRRWPKLWRWLAFGSINVQETTGLILQSDLPLHPKKRIRDQRRRCASFARSTPYSDERHSWKFGMCKGWVISYTYPGELPFVTMWFLPWRDPQEHSVWIRSPHRSVRQKWKWNSMNYILCIRIRLYLRYVQN